jgi:DNA-binding transcriptional LysR family regulator
MTPGQATDSKRGYNRQEGFVDYRQLQLFTAAAERGNLSQAAEAMGITQPGLSKSLQKLQRELGVRLYTRHGRGITLSEAGRTLMEHARLMDAHLADARAAVASIARGELGHARIGAGPDWIGRLLPMAIARVLERHPRLRFSVETGFPEKLIGRLRQRDLDAVIGALPEHRQDPDLRFQRIDSDEIRVVGRPDHPLLSKSHRTLADYAAYGWVLPQRTELLRQRLATVFHRAGLGEPRIAVESDSAVLLLATARRTDCLGLVTKRKLLHEEKDGLVLIDHEALHFRREAGLAVARHASPPLAVHALMTELRRLGVGDSAD